MKSVLFCLFVVCPFLLSSSKVHASQHNHTLHHKLHDWKLLHQDDVRIVKKRHKRSLDNEEVEEGEYDTFDKEIIFEIFGRKFHLSLFPNYDIFHKDFKAKFHGKNGKAEHVHFDRSQLMTGKLIDEADSFVNIHLNSETQMMLAHIHLPHDIYFVEPVWRHIPAYGDQHMVVYRYSDLKDNHFNHIHKKSHFCDTKPNKKENVRKMEKSGERKEVHVVRRRKRDAEEVKKKICTVTLVADQRFYKHMARENRVEAMSYLVIHMTSVDKLYLKTNWDPDGKEDISGYRLQIAGIVIHEERNNYTYTHGTGGEEVGASAQLNRFASYPHDTCLAHLFTFIDFENGLLGLAYVAELSPYSTEHGYGGGICATPQKQNPQSYNTGLTSMKNWGKTILSLEAYLVTAHEIGHNFGATHDESNSTYDCVPGQNRKGNYIMYPAAVPGTHENNFEFSNCSKQSVKRIIETRADWCFLKSDKNFARCGNFWKEPGEECDGGTEPPEDTCCDKKCKLIGNATCSPQNYRCCSNCQASPTTKLCANSIPGLCIGDSYCNGVSIDCPPPQVLDDGTECGDRGKCRNGTCQSFCATRGLRACLCQNKPDQCSRCCVQANATDMESCRVYKEDGEVEKLKDNSMCAIGYCTKGVCVKHTQDVITRVLDLISEIAPDKIGKLLADNIVGGVLVFSLIFWIPFSCFINFVDKKRLKHQEEEDARYFSQLDCYQRSIGATSGVMMTHSRYHPIAEHDPRAPPDGNSITDDEDDSGALSCATNPSSKGYFPQAKLNHTQITWSSDDDGVTSAEQQPIACDDETSRERLLDSQQQRPPFMRAQALIITSPTSPSPPDVMYMEPLHEEQEIVTSQRPSLHRQEATELL